MKISGDYGRSTLFDGTQACLPEVTPTENAASSRIAAIHMCLACGSENKNIHLCHTIQGPASEHSQINIQPQRLGQNEGWTQSYSVPQKGRLCLGHYHASHMRWHSAPNPRRGRTRHSGVWSSRWPLGAGTPETSMIRPFHWILK